MLLFDQHLFSLEEEISSLSDCLCIILNCSVFVNKDLVFMLCSSLTRTVKFPGDWGPLGIHVVPYCSSLSGR